jgi:hypothetical protein
MNALSMAGVNYRPAGEHVARDYLLIPCVGGSEHVDNRADSLLSVVDVTAREALASPLRGAYAGLDIQAAEVRGPYVHVTLGRYSKRRKKPAWWCGTRPRA